MNKFCYESGTVFVWGERGVYWVGGRAPKYRKSIICPACKRELKTRPHMVSPIQYGMIPRHKEPSIKKVLEN